MKRLIGNFTYEQASEICSYENELLLNRTNKPAYYPKVEKLLRDDISVLDYGGSSGGIYHSVKDRLKIKKWTVIETPMKLQEGDGILEFKDKIEGDYDIVIASGVLQYVTNWRKSLIELLSVGAELYIFARMSFGKERTYLQKSWLSENGVTNKKDRLIFYPHTKIPKREFMEYIKGVN